MSLTFSDICMQGYVRHKSSKIGTWSKQWFIVCKRSSKGCQRIERYADERAAQLRNEPKCIELLGVKEVTRCPNTVRKFAVSIEYNDGSNVMFSCDSDVEADEWVTALQKASTSTSLPPQTLDRAGRSRSVFSVYLLPTPMLSVYGECQMLITAEEVILRQIARPGEIIARWKLACLRRYGRDEDKFTFECGRQCKTGEGLFIFNTVEGESIYQSVHSATLAIASAHSLSKTTTRNRPAFNQSVSSNGTTASSSSRHSRVVASRRAPTTLDTRAPLPLPRFPKPRPPTPPPSPPPPRPENNSNTRDAAAADNSNDDNNDDNNGDNNDDNNDDSKDEDDYETLALDNDNPSRFPISSIDSMLSLSDPTRTNSQPQNGAVTGLLVNNQQVDEELAVNNNYGAEGGIAVNNNNENEVIYEEKHLDPKFRKFLTLRKADLEDNKSSDL